VGEPAGCPWGDDGSSVSFSCGLRSDVEALQRAGDKLSRQRQAAELLARKAEEARKEAQAHADRLRIALHAARAGVIDLDLESRTAWTSPEVAEIVGREVTFEDFAEQPWAMCHPDDRPRLDEMRAAWKSGRHPPLDLRILTASGECRWVRIHGEKLLGDDGRPAKIIGLVVDVDEWKRQELALVAAEKAAQEAAEAKAQFLANMSHEIRTPMNGVLGVLHLLRREALSEEGETLLGEAESCGRMLSQLLDDVIDFSKIEAGRLELSPEPLNAADTLESVASLLRPQAESRGLQVRTRVEGENPWILADPVRLRQALFNLIGNAVKFTLRGHVEARLAVRAEDGGGRRLRFEIEDTGVGMPAAAQAGLFQRFHRGDASTASRFSGSGLGLAITRQIAELMGGDLGFISSEGAGSTFWIEISAPDAPEPVAESAPAAAAGLEGLKILLAEDNPTNRMIAVRILEGMGASVQTAEDGLEALKAVSAQRFDLVLMDVQMPRMGGVEATRRIRATDGPQAAIPIIALTADTLAHQRKGYVAAGMDGLVAKPMSPVALVQEIVRVIADADNPDRPLAGQSLQLGG